MLRCYGLRGIYGRFDSKIRFEIESDGRFDSRFDSNAKNDSQVPTICTPSLRLCPLAAPQLWPLHAGYIYWRMSRAWCYASLKFFGKKNNAEKLINLHSKDGFSGETVALLVNITADGWWDLILRYLLKFSGDCAPFPKFWSTTLLMLYVPSDMVYRQQLIQF